MIRRHTVFTYILSSRHYSSCTKNEVERSTVIEGCHYPRDKWTNVTENVLSYLGRNIHLQNNHPLSLIRQRIVNHFYRTFVGRTGNAIFSVYDNLNPVVTLEENFDSLLIPLNHPSRCKTDCYYLNCAHLLRAHTTAHQAKLISMGLNNFLIIGDVYRRDEIDSTHYPVFHQLDGVRLCTAQDLFPGDTSTNLTVFDKGVTRNEETQENYSRESSQLMTNNMKNTLEKMALTLFGKDVKTRWVSAFFPFTHPSWELEIFHNGKWMEVLGCGIIEHQILKRAGAVNNIGWAFGLGLERLAMHLYSIPDIRLFWSKDTGFLSQFNVEDPEMAITYKPISIYPQCSNDMSFWLPENDFSPNDFYDLVRTIGGNLVEQVSLIDEFTHPKENRTSHCYRIVYRHMERTLSQEEVTIIHKKIEAAAASELRVVLR